MGNVHYAEEAVMARRKGIPKVYGGENEELNEEVKGWFQEVGYMYYPCEEGVMCKVKEALGGEDWNVVVQRGKKAMVVMGGWDREMLEEYLRVK